MIDGLRLDIYNGISPEKSDIQWMNKLIRDNCNRFHFECIDLSSVFEKDFKKNKTHFEFNNDWHWNEYGHQVVADTLSKLLLSTKTNNF